MKLPRDVRAQALIKALQKLGYEPVRQTGSHIRITTLLNGAHGETIPSHSPLKTGTLNAILKSIAEHHGLTRDDLLKMLDL
jgi:predicted RNA binding protein YcfA (HicA-like mRNA interferase family)